MFKRVLLGLGFLLMLYAGAAGADQCVWARSEVDPGPWRTTQGACQLTISGDQFNALLYGGKDTQWVEVKINGLIHGEAVTAKVELEGTDANIQNFTGTFKQTDFVYKKVIILVNGFDMIGIKVGPG